MKKIYVFIFISIAFLSSCDYVNKLKIYGQWELDSITENDCGMFFILGGKPQKIIFYKDNTCQIFTSSLFTGSELIPIDCQYSIYSKHDKDRLKITNSEDKFDDFGMVFFSDALELTVGESNCKLLFKRVKNKDNSQAESDNQEINSGTKEKKEENSSSSSKN